MKETLEVKLDADRYVVYKGKKDGKLRKSINNDLIFFTVIVKPLRTVHMVFDDERFVQQLGSQGTETVKVKDEESLATLIESADREGGFGPRCAVEDMPVHVQKYVAEVDKEFYSK